MAFLACGFVIKKKAILIRIGNALLGMAIESTTSASEVNRYIRERARVSEQQKMQLKRFEGKNAIATLSQSVGTLVAFYCTFASVGLYEAFASKAVPPVVMRACVVLLLASPVVNGFIFGLKNKVSKGRMMFSFSNIILCY